MSSPEMIESLVKSRDPEAEANLEKVEYEVVRGKVFDLGNLIVIGKEKALEILGNRD
jgi:hypothetical protein